MAKVQSLDRALDILEILSVEQRGLGVTEIGNRLGLHKSTVHRLLTALGERGYVEKDSKYGLYKIGLKIVELSSLHLNNIELKTESAPYLQNLARLTKQPVHLATIIDGELVYIDKVKTVNSIRMYSSIGKRIPIHCTAVGKVMLSSFSDDELLKTLKNIKIIKYTENTKTDIDEIISEVKEVRKKGWALDNMEHEDNIRCIAAPIYDYRNKVIGAVSTSGIKTIITPDDDEKIKDYVIATAHEISKRMGYIGPSKGKSDGSINL